VSNSDSNVSNSSFNRSNSDSNVSNSGSNRSNPRCFMYQYRLSFCNSGINLCCSGFNVSSSGSIICNSDSNLYIAISNCMRYSSLISVIGHWSFVLPMTNDQCVPHLSENRYKFRLNLYFSDSDRFCVGAIKSCQADRPHPNPTPGSDACGAGQPKLS
jgi:hypothetical protein